MAEDALENLIHKYLEEGNGVVDSTEVGGDMDPAKEGAPLFPGNGVLLTDQGRKILVDSLEFRMEFS